MLAAWDTAGRGSLDLSSFSQLVADVRCFCAHDADRNGTLDATELAAALTSLGVGGAAEAHAGAPGGAPVTIAAFAAIVRGRTTRAATADDMANDMAPPPPHGRGSKSKLTGTGLAADGDAAGAGRLGGSLVGEPLTAVAELGTDQEPLAA